MTVSAYKTFAFGDVVFLPFPFTDLNGKKERPAVIIHSRGFQSIRPDIIVMPITSKLNSPSNSDSLVIQEWQAANLLKPSVIKPIIQTLEQNLVTYHLGSLSVGDCIRLQSYLHACLDLGQNKQASN